MIPEFPIPTQVKTYIAILNATGTANPTATVLKNTYGAPIVWEYQSDGYWTGTLNNAFTIGKTTCLCSTSANKVGFASINASANLDKNYVELIQALNTNAAPENGILTLTIQIQTFQ